MNKNIKSEIEKRIEELKEKYNKKIEEKEKETIKANDNAFNSSQELINALNNNKNVSNAIAKDTQARYLQEKTKKEKESAIKENYLNDNTLNAYIEETIKYYKPLLNAYASESLEGIEQLKNGINNILEDLSEMEEIKRKLLIDAKKENNIASCENFISKYEKQPVFYTQKHVFMEIKNGETVQRLKRFKDALEGLQEVLNNEL